MIENIKKIITKADVILFFALVLIGVLGAVFVFIQASRSSGTGSSGDPGSKNGEAGALACVVKMDGREYKRYPLAEDGTVKLGKDERHNEISIKDGLVRMENSNCPNHECEKQGAISKPGETIVCLPNRLVIEIESTEGGSAGGGPDAISG